MRIDFDLCCIDSCFSIVIGIEYHRQEYFDLKLAILKPIRCAIFKMNKQTIDGRKMLQIYIANVTFKRDEQSILNEILF